MEREGEGGRTFREVGEGYTLTRGKVRERFLEHSEGFEKGIR